MSGSYSILSYLNPFAAGTATVVDQPTGILPPGPVTGQGLTPLALITKNFQAEEFLLLQEKIRKLNAVIRQIKKDDDDLSPLPNLFSKLKKSDEKALVPENSKVDAKSTKVSDEKKSESYVQHLIKQLKDKSSQLLLSDAIRQVGEKAHEQMQETHKKLQLLKGQMNTGPAKDLIIQASLLTIEYVRQLELMINDVLHLISIDENFKSIAEKIAEKCVQVVTRTNATIQLSNSQDQARTIYNNTFEALNVTADTVEKVTRDIDRLIVFYEEQVRELNKPLVPVNNKQAFLEPEAKSNAKTKTKKTTPHPNSMFVKRPTPIKLQTATPACSTNTSDDEISPLTLK